jgi:hypothetical protein
VEAALPEPEHALRLTGERIAAAADAVIASISIASLLARAQAVQDDLVASRVVLRYLLRANVIACGPEKEAVRRFLCAREQVISGALSFGPHQSSVEFQSWDGHVAAVPWRAARELLLHDPNSPPPE